MVISWVGLALGLVLFIFCLENIGPVFLAWLLAAQHRVRHKTVRCDVLKDLLHNRVTYQFPMSAWPSLATPLMETTSLDSQILAQTAWAPQILAQPVVSQHCFLTGMLAVLKSV